MQNWKKISSKVILDHPRMKVVEDIVELPSGKITDYVRYGNEGEVVTIICRNNDNKILLQKEYSYPPNEELYQFPGGFVPKNEETEIGANRELMEEAKYRANKLSIIGSYFVNNRKSDVVCSVFLGTDLNEEARNGDEEEIIESYWFNELEIDEMIRVGEIRNVSVLAAWSLYKLKK